MVAPTGRHRIARTDRHRPKGLFGRNEGHLGIAREPRPTQRGRYESYDDINGWCRRHAARSGKNRHESSTRCHAFDRILLLDLAATCRNHHARRHSGKKSQRPSSFITLVKRLIRFSPFGISAPIDMMRSKAIPSSHFCGSVVGSSTAAALIARKIVTTTRTRSTLVPRIRSAQHSHPDLPSTDLSDISGG